MGKDITASEPVRANHGILHTTFGHIVIGILAAALVGVSVWGTMTLAGNRDLTAARGQSAQELADSRARLAVVTRTAAIREAQVRLYESAIELERRNFGTANTRLRDAGKALSALPGAKDDAKVVQLQRAVASLDLTVVTDVSTQRNQVLQLAEEAGALVPAP